jgi:hypothetical protein
MIFPCRQPGRAVNLYGRSIDAASPRRLLPRSKGVRNTTCAIGIHLTPEQGSQLGDQPGRCVYIAFDRDPNQAGQRASRLLARRLKSASLNAGIVPCRQDRITVPRPPTSSPVWRERNFYETLSALLACRPRSVSPYRLVDNRGLTGANDFLDAQRIRQLSRCSL